MSQIIHIIDDDQIVRNSIRLLLATEGFETRAYASGRDFLNAVNPDDKGCVVTDMRMPRMSGVELLIQISERGLFLPVIIITGHADVPLAVDAMKLGAVDFMEKPVSDSALIDAVRKALQRHGSRSEQDSTMQEIRSRLAKLSTREREVLEGLLHGKSNKGIGCDLGLSYRTVEIYRANLMKKLQAGSLPELVRLSIVATNGHA